MLKLFELTKGIIVISVFAGFSVLASACSTADPVVPKGMVVGDRPAELTHPQKVQLQEEIIKQQELEKERQKREMEDIQRQRYHNDSLNRYK